MKAKEFDELFDRGQNVSSALDLTNLRRPDSEQRPVNVNFPLPIDSADREAETPPD